MDNKTPEKLNQEYQNYPYKLISNTELEKGGFKWFMKDTIPKTLPDNVYILNTGTSASGGEHWQVFAVQYPKIFFVGSYGATSEFRDRPSKELIDFAKRNNFEDIYCYEHDLQIPTAWTCGHFAMYIGSLLKKNLGSLTEKSFDRLIDGEFDKKPTAYNNEKVVKWAQRKRLI